MVVEALLRHRDSGLERRYVHELDSPAQAQWMWTEGNYGCDCNRSLFLYGVPPDDPLELPCSRGEPTIELIELVVDGEQIRDLT